MTELAVPPAPGTPEWMKLVTASKVAGILGISPWDSPVSLWLKMKGIWDPNEDWDPDGPLARGTHLENGLLDWWVSKHPEFPHLDRQAYRTRGDLPGMAATLDGLAWNGMRGRFGVHALVEAKTAARLEDWGRPGTDEVPAYYKAQVDFQFAMTPEARIAYVVGLGPFLDLREYVVHRNEERIAVVIQAALDFQQSLVDDAPPPLDNHEATFTAVKASSPDVLKGNTATVSEELAWEFITSLAAEKDAEIRARAAKTQILAAAKQDQYVETPGGVRIARRQPNRSGISLVPLFKTQAELDAALTAAALAAVELEGFTVEVPCKDVARIT